MLAKNNKKNILMTYNITSKVEYNVANASSNKPFIPSYSDTAALKVNISVPKQIRKQNDIGSPLKTKNIFQICFSAIELLAAYITQNFTVYAHLYLSFDKRNDLRKRILNLS